MKHLLIFQLLNTMNYKYIKREANNNTRKIDIGIKYYVIGQGSSKDMGHISEIYY